MKALLGEYVEEECVKVIRALHKYGMAHEVLEFACALLAACEEDFGGRERNIRKDAASPTDSTRRLRLVLIRGARHS